jgi:two-component sensor histidine kinase
MDRETGRAYRAILAAKGAVTFGPEADLPLAGEIPLRFHERSLVMMALYPKTGMPWVFGLQQCSYPRAWTQDERRLFEEIGRRLALLLSSLLARRDLSESEAYYRSLFEDSANAIAEEDFSALQSYLADLGERGVADLSGFFTERPEELIRCAGLIRIVRTNAEYRRMVGAEGAQEVSATLAPYLNRNKDALEGFRDEILALSEGRMPFDREFPNAPLPSDIKWVRLRMSIVPGYEKDWSRVLASFMDITEQKRIESKLEKAAREKEFLMRELEHRVKNNLHIISSLLSLDSQRFADHEMKQVLVDAQMRIQSIALIYDFLSHSSSLDKLDSAIYAEDLIRLLYDTYTDARSDIRVKRVIDSFELGIKEIVPLGLIINELLSNAFKYAFPTGRNGEITVELRKTESAVTLRVLDDGAGLPQGFDWKASKSLGLQLVNMLSAQLGGTMTLSSEAGVTVTIEIPATGSS